MRAGAIFDMDGLLFDTELVYNQEWYYIAELYGLRLILRCWMSCVVRTVPV